MKGVIDYGVVNLNDDISLKVKLVDIIIVLNEEMMILVNKLWIVWV